MRAFVALMLAACGGGGGPSGAALGDDAFRAAIPARGDVTIDFHPAGVGVPEERAEVIDFIEDHVRDLDEALEVFQGLRDLARGVPEVATPAMRRWREPIGEEIEAVIEVRGDGEVFVVEVFVGYDGFDPLTQQAVIGGTATVRDGAIDELAMGLFFDRSSLLDRDDEFDGELHVTMTPFGDGRELRYDLVAFAIDDEPPRTETTTYWDFGALELTTPADGGVPVPIYARWSTAGGRVDFQGSFDGGIAVATVCWNADGAAVFEAYAIIDDGGAEGLLTGSEASCAFGPLDDHPDPGDDFDEVPAEGDWDDLVSP